MVLCYNKEANKELFIGMKKNFLLLIGLLVGVCFEAKAQYDPSLTHYWMLEPQFNPATVGVKPNKRVVGCYSNQLSGYTDNPKTMFLGADMPL